MMTRTLAGVMLLTTSLLAAAQAEPIVGADISHLPQLEAAGAKFYDQDATAAEDLLQILKRNGVNRIRLKVWNEPGKYAEFPSDQSGPEGYNNPAHVVAMAKRAKAAGLQVMIDFHYSDWWADPGKQTMPVAWRNQDAAAVSEKLYAFTRDVMQQLKEAGVTPAEVQVGNEISNGMLWPLGRVPEWDNLARFIQAGARAVKAVSPQSQVVLHLDAGCDVVLVCHPELVEESLQAVAGRSLNTAALLGLIAHGAMGWGGLLADARHGDTAADIAADIAFTLQPDSSFNAVWGQAVREAFAAELAELTRPIADTRERNKAVKAFIDGLQLTVVWTHRHYIADDEYIPFDPDGEPADYIPAFLAREIAKPIIRWQDSPQLGYEILPNKYFYRYQPPKPASELLAEFWALEKEAEGMLEGMSNRER